MDKDSRWLWITFQVLWSVCQRRKRSQESKRWINISKVYSVLENQEVHKSEKQNKEGDLLIRIRYSSVCKHPQIVWCDQKNN
jgi:hypothetical protein